VYDQIFDFRMQKLSCRKNTNTGRGYRQFSVYTTREVYKKFTIMTDVRRAVLDSVRGVLAGGVKPFSGCQMSVCTCQIATPEDQCSSSVGLIQ